MFPWIRTDVSAYFIQSLSTTEALIYHTLYLTYLLMINLEIGLVFFPSDIQLMWHSADMAFYYCTVLFLYGLVGMALI